MTDTEVFDTGKSVFGYLERGELRSGQHGAYFVREQAQDLARDPNLLALITWLKAENGPKSEFWIADGLCSPKYLHWPIDYGTRAAGPLKRDGSGGSWSPQRAGMPFMYGAHRVTGSRLNSWSRNSLPYPQLTPAPPGRPPVIGRMGEVELTCREGIKLNARLALRHQHGPLPFWNEAETIAFRQVQALRDRAEIGR